MKKRILGALICTLLGTAGAGAADRELLFGPETSVQPKKSSEAAQAQKAPRAPKEPRVPKTVKTQPLPPAVISSGEAPAAPVQSQAPAVIVGIPGGEGAGALKRMPALPRMPAAPSTASAGEASKVMKVTKAPTPVSETSAPITANKTPAAVAAAPAPAVQVPAPVAKAPAAPSVAVAPKEVAPVPAPAAVAAAAAAAPVAAARAAPVFVDLPKGLRIADPVAERKALLGIMDRAAVVGLPPTASVQNNFSSISTYWPVLNYLSRKVNVLLDPAFETDFVSYREKVANRDFALIYIDASLADVAAQAGYVAFARSTADLAPVFVVGPGGPGKLAGLRGKSIGFVGKMGATGLGFAELTKAGLGNNVRSTDFGLDGLSVLGAALTAQTVEAALVDNFQAGLLLQANPKLRVIHEGVAQTAFFWAYRQGAFDGKTLAAISSAVTGLNASAAGADEKLMLSLMSKAHGQMAVSFEPADPKAMEPARIAMESAAAQWPGFAAPVVIDEQRAARNASLGGIFAVSRVVANDARSERAKLLKGFTEGMNIGFFPSTNTNQDVYGFQTSFLPLANYLSSDIGVAVSLVPERNVNDYVRRIAENVYPAIVIGPSMASAAISSGYLPVARGGEFISPGFLVPVNSPLRTLKDLANRRVATVKASDAATVGRWELAELGVKNVSFDFFGNRGSAAEVLAAGANDAVLLRASEAQLISRSTLTAEGKPKYRVILGNKEIPTISAWVRHDAYDSALMQRLASAMQDLGPTGSELKRRAFEGLVRGLGDTQPWQASGIEEHTTSVAMTDGLNKLGQGLVDAVVPNDAAAMKNRALPLTFGLAKL